jgi:desulfoferrodoxin-like iron-binding protein
VLDFLPEFLKGEFKMANVKKIGEIYKCEICGNVVEVKKVGGGELVCCGQPMKLEKGK